MQKLKDKKDCKNRRSCFHLHLVLRSSMSVYPIRSKSLRLITTMVALVLISPFLYLALLENYPHSFWTKNFIWIYLGLLLFVFLSNLHNKS